MAEHTKEPWGKERYDISNPFAPSIPHIFIEGGGRTIADVGLWTDMEARQEANGARIVATVNACAGISTEALEGGVVKELVTVMGAATGLIITFRDTKLKAADLTNRVRIVLERAQAALDKVKEVPK